LFAKNDCISKAIGSCASIFNFRHNYTDKSAASFRSFNYSANIYCSTTDIYSTATTTVSAAANSISRASDTNSEVDSCDGKNRC
jgi:hypothetical protein